MTLHQTMTAVTDFGNLAVACPVGLMLTLSCRLTNLASILAVGMLGATAATFALKLVSREFGGGLADTPFHFTVGAPSGHAALAAAVYGSAIGLFAFGSRGVLRIIAVGLATAIVLGVAVTRVTLGTHSPADVVFGLLVGSISIAATWLAAARHAGPWPMMPRLLLSLILVAAVMQISGLRAYSTVLF